MPSGAIPLMKLGLTPLPSRFARPIVSLVGFAQQTNALAAASRIASAAVTRPINVTSLAGLADLLPEAVPPDG